MSDPELLEAGLDVPFAAFAVGALLSLTLISATAFAYLRNSVGEGWGPRWEAGAAFRVSVLVALWVGAQIRAPEPAMMMPPFRGEEAPPCEPF
jgi:hypothetical protein